MEIATGFVVTIEYTLRDAAGKVLETSSERGPITFRLGSDRMLPGVEKVLHGMKVNEVRTGIIPPGQLVPLTATGYRHVGWEEFPEGMRPELKQRFQAKGVDGQPVLFEVVEKDDTGVRVHLLHPLHRLPSLPPHRYHSLQKNNEENEHK